MPVLSPNQRRAANCRLLLFAILGILVLMVAGFIAFFNFKPVSPQTLPTQKVTPSITGTPSLGIGVVKMANGEDVGLSDGTYAFDTGTDRSDRDLKLQAAAQLKKGDRNGAMSLLNRAVGRVGIDTSDAEALIYLENQSVLATNQPHVTFVVGTMLTGTTGQIGAGRDDLQGAYVAQKEYNDGLKLNGGVKIVLLIANAGSKEDYIPQVAQQIIQQAKQDATIVGVMGWPYSAYAERVAPILGAAGIPMVSQTASSDELTKISPFFFRVAPTNDAQAKAAANYARDQLHARRVALFVDQGKNYSKSLANDFQKHFTENGGQIVDIEQYVVKNGQQALPNLLQKAAASRPDLIYFAGYSDDMAVVLVNLPPSQPNLQVLGGDALYDLNGYNPSARAGFNRLHFTAFAYPDEWDILGMASDKPRFFDEYKYDFNPAGQYGGGKYGYTRAANDVILSYDATLALLQGCKNVLDAEKRVTPSSLKDGLGKITSDHPMQGVSGQIAFGTDGNSINKAIVVLYVDPEGHIKLLENRGIQGCFRVGSPCI